MGLERCIRLRPSFWKLARCLLRAAMHRRTDTGILILLCLLLVITAETAPGECTELMTPMERAATTSRGELKSPYPDFASVAEEGHRKYMAAGCNGCHGGGGGGGMAAPLTNPIWVYGDDDDTLFRLIALGTGKLSPGDAFGKLGYQRKGSEGVVGPMPHFGDIIKTDDDLWKIIAWIRSVYCERRAEGC
jgi:mono/diheme cytochrome c family protein